MNRVKKRLAYLLAAVLLFALIAPAAPGVAVLAATKNPITELGIAKLPEGNTIQVGDVFNFNPDIIATELGKGKTTGKVWWEVNTQTNTAGVTSSRWGYVYPVYAGGFEIRALAFANAQDMEAWKAARSANGKVADEAATASYVTAMTDWVKIDVVSDTEGYAVARSQYQLRLALKNSAATDIQIKTNRALNFTIAAKSYTNRTLTVDAPNAEVENAGRFAQINIRQIKASTFYEKAYGNRFRVTAPDARIVFLNSARTGEVVFEPEKTAEAAQLTLVGEGGTLSTLNIKAAGQIDIKGDIFADRTGKAVVVNVAEEAAGTTIQTSTALEVNALADVAVTVNQAETGEAAPDAPKTVINMEKAVKVSVDGTAADGTTVVVKGEAKGSEIASDAALIIIADADVILNLTENAAGTTVTKGENVKVELSVQSTVDEVSVTDVNGEVETIKPGEDSAQVTAAPSATPIPSVTPVPTMAPSGGSSSGSSTPSYPVTPSTPTPTPTPTDTPVPSETPDYIASYTLDGKVTGISVEEGSKEAVIILPAESLSKTITVDVDGTCKEQVLEIGSNLVWIANYEFYFIVPVEQVTLTASLSDIKFDASNGAVTGSAILALKPDILSSEDIFNGFFDATITYEWKKGNEVISDSSVYRKAVEVAVNGNIVTYQETEQYSLVVKMEYETIALPDLQSNISVNISLEKELPTPLNEAKVGDIVAFGNYEQNNNLFDGTEEIEWIVLDKQGDKMLLLSKYILDVEQFDDGVALDGEPNCIWGENTLSKWLDNDFYNTAFKEDDKELIETTTLNNYMTYGDGERRREWTTENKVFLLGLDDVTETYFHGVLSRDEPWDTKLNTEYTEYARENGEKNRPYTDWNVHVIWFLRTAISSEAAWAVYQDFGEIDFGGSGWTGVRPAIWVNISTGATP